MSFRLLLDENLPADLALVLGDPCLHATALGAQPTDEALWLHARDEGLVILTKDADFFERLAIHGAPPKVVWLRTGNMRRTDLEEVVRKVWPRVRSMLNRADLVEIHRDRLEAIRF